MDIRQIMLQRESLFSKNACFDKDAVRLKEDEADIRPEFFRDIDRIIHTSSYTRYMDKTQVFSITDNDNISKRMTHVQLVSKIARTIGRALSLNEDLIEAISLGHDLGHVPFGHAGEAMLNDISHINGEGNFMHNVQSVRNLMYLENKNITFQVLDGILCHNGEFVSNEYYPKKKTIEEFLTDYNECYKNANHAKKLIPMTLEGCVVRISDIIGYLGRDIEDAIRLKVLKINDIPDNITKILGNTNKDIVNTIILDIINNSLEKPYLKLSDNVYKAIVELKEFNYQNIYYKANTKKELDSYAQMFKVIFDKSLLILKNKDISQGIYLNFLNDMNEEYLNNTTDARKVIDYIAGMTDDYFLKEYSKLKDLI